MNVEIRRMLLTQDAKAELTRLRTTAYSPKFGDRLRDDALKWNTHDDQSFHFGAYSSGKLVSTIRLTHVQNRELFETMLQCSADDPFANLPCWILSRAATATQYRNQSLNLKLRAAAYEFVLSRLKSDSKEKFIYGTALGTSQRLTLLKNLGYEIQTGRQKWDGYISAEPKEVSIFRLSVDKLESAVRLLLT